MRSTLSLPDRSGITGMQTNWMGPRRDRLFLHPDESKLYAPKERRTWFVTVDTMRKTSTTTSMAATESRHQDSMKKSPTPAIVLDEGRQNETPWKQAINISITPGKMTDFQPLTEKAVRTLIARSTLKSHKPARLRELSIRLRAVDIITFTSSFDSRPLCAFNCSNS